MEGSYPEEEFERDLEQELSPAPAKLHVYAEIEGLVGEESELLERAEQSDKHERHERLDSIRQELDRAWETLRERAERQAKPGN